MSDNNVSAPAPHKASSWGQMAEPILAAQISAQRLGKDSRNEFQNYAYTSAEDIIIEARRCLHENGLALVKNGWFLTWIGDDEDKVLAVEAMYLLVHKDGYTASCRTVYPVCPGKGRPQDKAVNASLTTGLAYFLRDLLMIPRCDEEVDARADAIDGTRGRSAIRSTPTPKKSGKSNKQRFMESVSDWINRDLGDEDVTKACIDLIKVHKLPTDGSCSPRQFGELATWVQEQIQDKTDPGTILREPEV